MQSLPIKFTIFSPDKEDHWFLSNFDIQIELSVQPESNSYLKVTGEINIPGALHHPTWSTTFCHSVDTEPLFENHFQDWESETLHNNDTL